MKDKLHKLLTIFRQSVINFGGTFPGVSDGKETADFKIQFLWLPILFTLIYTCFGTLLQSSSVLLRDNQKFIATL